MRRWRILLVLAAGIACLFWTYTLLLGIAILGLVVLSLWAPHMIPGSLATSYELRPHLHHPLTFTISDEFLAVSGPRLDLRCRWPNLAVWREADGWLRLTPHGMQALYFRVSDLQVALIYERVIELCRQHGCEYGEQSRAA
jgi:hypothetical protein